MAAAKKKMRFDDSYIKYGFSMIKVGQVEKPQCVLCCEVLAETSLKPSKLKRHLQTKDREHASKDIEYFKLQEVKLLESRLDMSGTFSKKVVAGVRASYEVARKKKSHTLGEELILPCCKNIISLVFGEEVVEKLTSVSLSNNTIFRRITDMSFNILNQVVEKIKKSTFGMYAIQLDETTDITNLAQLCCYVRYTYNGEFEDEFLFCDDLKSRTTAKDIFEKVSNFFEEHDLDWQNLCGVVRMVRQLCWVISQAFKLW